MTEEEIVARLTLLAEVTVQMHEDMLSMVKALGILNARITALETWKAEGWAARDRGIGRSP